MRRRRRLERAVLPALRAACGALCLTALVAPPSWHRPPRTAQLLAPPSSHRPPRTALFAPPSWLRSAGTAQLAPPALPPWRPGFYAYQFTAFNSELFDARTMGLNNAAYWASQMAGAVALGSLLDTPALSLRARAGGSLLLIYALVGLSWGLGLHANGRYGLDHPNATAAKIDFTAPASWAPPAALYVLWGACDSFVQCWVYWVLGRLDDRPEVLSRFAGGYKALQSAGAAVSWGLSTGPLLPSSQAYVNVGLLLLSLPPVGYLLLTAPQLQREAVAPVDPAQHAEPRARGEARGSVGCR